MTTLNSRLQKVTQALSPLQRAMLVVRAQRDGRECDPELLRFDDPQQRRAFDRYMGLGFVINRELGNAGLVLHERVAIGKADERRTVSDFRAGKGRGLIVSGLGEVSDPSPEVVAVLGAVEPRRVGPAIAETVAPSPAWES